MSSAASGHNVPVVDVSPLIHDSSSSSSSFSPTLRPCCDALLHALEEFGFVYVTGVPSVIAASDALIAPSQHFLTKQSQPYKEQISMKIRPREWRGWFGVGDELTNGVADLKEGLYFGVEHDASCEQIKKGLPMHGQNKLPPEHDYPNMRKALATYFTEAEALGAAILRGVAIALGLDETHFTPLFEPTPFSLLRVFHYPAELQEEQAGGSRWGVAEHTDYGMLTLLRQDDVGGLEVKHRATGTWIDAPPIKDTLVVNVGDALQVATGGRCISTPHRVRNVSGTSRISMPFFYDPSFEARLPPPPPHAASSIIGFDGSIYAKLHAASEDGSITWRDYITAKTSKVFPHLAVERDTTDV